MRICSVAMVAACAGACGRGSYTPPPPAVSSLLGTTQLAVLVGYDAKAKLVELSPAVLHVEGDGKGHYEAAAGASTYSLPLSADPRILSAKALCPGGKPDRDLMGTTPCTVDQLIVSLMTRRKVDTQMN